MPARPDRDTRPVITDLDGNPVSLDDLPLSAFRLACGHVHKGVGYLKGDLFFCDTCGTHKRISKIVG